MAAVTTDARAFNFHKSEQMQDPFPFYAQARSACPVARSDQLGGFYYAPAYAETRRVFEDFRTFSSTDGTALPKQPMALFPEDLDPPIQTKYRKILNPRFTPDYVLRFRQRLQTLVDGYIDAFIERGEAELEDDLIRPTLAYTVLPMLGVPIADMEQVSTKVDYINRNRTLDPEGTQQRGGELAVYLINLVAGRRQETDPTDDIIQLLIGSAIDDVPLDDAQIFSVLMIILFGGLDTTSAALGEGFYHLARHPKDAEQLRSGAVPWSSAIEEFVRFTSPVQALRRTVRKEVELGGHTLQPGDFVMALSGAANRDPAQFDRPDEIVIDRVLTEKDHVAFGAGAHICLGRHFARMAMEIMLRTVLTRLPDLTLPDGFVPEYAVGEARGMKKLPVLFAPRLRSAA